MLDHLQRLAEVVLGLPREADDDVRPERQIGDGRAHPFGEGEIPFARVGPAHRFQEPRRTGLKRQMHVLAHRGALRHGCDHGLAEVLRVRAREAHALDPLDRIAGSKQFAELGLELRAQITSPRVDVLPEERDLLDAVSGKALDLGDDLSRATALLASAHRRDDAVRALRVAAHRDLHPRLERAFVVQRQLRGEVAVVQTEAPSRDAHAARPEPFAEMRDRTRPEGNIDRRVELEDPLALRLGIAAADGDHPIRMLSLASRGFAQVRGELRVGLLPDRAGVEDHDIRLVGARRFAEPDLLEHALDPLGIVSVHLAAEGGHEVPAHRRRVAVPCRRGPAREILAR